jgi:predicted glycosyltransferase
VRDTIWFDAASPPQVLWFSGLASALTEKGFDLLVTARSLAGTADLAKRFLPQLDQVVEGHDPGGLVRKLAAIGGRAFRLRKFVRQRSPGRLLAVSHNSYAQIVAARTLGIPVLTSMDYEGQPANHLAFRLAHRVLLPEAFPVAAAARQGAQVKKIDRYPGVKESIYLEGDTDVDGDGSPNPHSAPLAVVRPEADFATYQDQPNPLLPLVIEHLLASGAQVLVLPRGEEQRQALAKRWGDQVSVADEVVDGPALLRRADLVVGGGGTMTREAAVLGTPAYSIFWGDAPAVDLSLERMGLLRILRRDVDVQTIEVKPRLDGPPPLLGPETRNAVVAAIGGFAERYR